MVIYRAESLRRYAAVRSAKRDSGANKRGSLVLGAFDNNAAVS
jgi:hypothetical protein